MSRLSGADCRTTLLQGLRYISVALVVGASGLSTGFSSAAFAQGANLQSPAAGLPAAPPQSAAQEKVYWVDELIGQLPALQGNIVRVRGWLDECIGDQCVLLPRAPNAADRREPAPTRPRGLRVGRVKEFDLSANLHRFQGVEMRVRVLAACEDRSVCEDRAGDILPMEPPRIVEKLTTRAGWPALFRGGALQPRDTIGDPALMMAVRSTLDDIVSRDVARIEQAFLRYDPSRRVSYAGKPALREEDLLRLAAVLVEGPDAPAALLAGGKAARAEIRILRDPEIEPILADVLEADDATTACICLKAQCSAEDWPRDLSELLHNRANPYICLDAAKRDGFWRVSPY